MEPGSVNVTDSFTITIRVKFYFNITVLLEKKNTVIFTVQNGNNLR